MNSTPIDGMAVPDEVRLYQQERLLLEVTEGIGWAMRKQGIKRSELAERLHMTRGRVTQILSGASNLTLRTVADMLTAIGRTLQVRIVPLTQEVTDFSRDDSMEVVLSHRRVAVRTVDNARWPSAADPDGKKMWRSCPIQSHGDTLEDAKIGIAS